MSRGLNTDQVSNLQLNPYRLERLIEIKTPSTDYYYTTGTGDVTVTTPTSGSQTFLAENGVQLFGEIGEIYDFGVNEIVVQIGDVSNTVYAELTRAANNFDFPRTEVHIYMAFRSVTTGLVSSDIINLYSGQVYKIDATRDTEELAINLRCSSQFSNFAAVNGRSVSDFPGSLIQSNLQFGTRSRR